jgi:pyruvate dehydrogenase E2 component (dihydrolipoamide acetyltransferase)
MKNRLSLSSLLTLNTSLFCLQTMESGTIASWNKTEGEAFGAGDSLCTVETDKATVDFEAQDEGVIAKILAQAGSAEIQCGEPILITVDDEADVAAFANYVVAPTSAPPPSAVADVPPPAPPAAAPIPPPAPTTAGTLPTSRVVASPLAHMLAKDMGHDISSIPGTGPGGRVIAADVKEFLPTSAAATAAAAAVVDASPTLASTTTTPSPAQVAMAAAPPIPGVGFTDYPLSASAQETAAALTHSKQNVPHYYLTVDITMDALLALRMSLNYHLDDSSKIGMYELLIKAAAAAMKACPSANASWMDSVVRVYESVDINVVVGNGNALYTPVLRDAGGRGVASIGADLKNFIAASIGEEDLSEEFGSMGTFTVMNLGMYGIKSCAPIIREPQACALALGAMENCIVPSDEGEEEIYKESVILTATLSCDHRVVDGAVGAQWLSAFKSHVENPNTLLL